MNGSRFAAGSLTITLALAASGGLAAEVPEYVAMRQSRPDGRSVEAKNLTLARDAYRIHFRSGVFHLLAPLGERTWGAVFIGEGSWELRPKIESERRHLALVTGKNDLEILSDTFSSMVLLFSDGTAGEIALSQGVMEGKPDPRATQLYDEYLEDQKRKYRINFHLRVLQELLNEQAARGDVFLAVVDGKELAPALLLFDRHGIGALAAGFADLSGEETALLSFDEQNGGFWYLAAAMDRRDAGRSSAPRRAVDATHYEIDTTIESNLNLRGSTTVHMMATTPGVRVVPLQILPKVRLRRVTLGDGAERVDAPFVQEEVDLGRLARLFRDEVADADAAVILPAALEVGKPVKLFVEYEGREVLRSVGADSFSVRARESWYPNLGTFADTATYELTYRYPRRNDLVSTGILSSVKEESGQNVAVWKSAVPMRIAGFNYGKFHKISRHDEPSDVDVDVYTSRDRRKFADDAMADALNASRVGHVYFGRLPYTPFSVTQQVEWNFGQSWPSLIYLPTLALTSSTERVMAFGNAGPMALFNVNEFAKMVGWHEVAHQWWGHAVGWESYRDSWISEGFAEFTAALVLNLVDSPQKYDDYWERRRREILQKQPGSTIADNDAGPISQGFRLNTRWTPGAAQTVIYSKGAYVLHMLRALMRDSRSENQDARFIVMMKEFLAEYAWKSPSTDDFRRIVERHMTPPMNAAGSGTMDWFFDQWVHGTEVPRFRSTLTAQPAAGGKFKISGAVSQEGVSAGFRSVVPIYVDFGNDAVIPLGSIRLTGTVPQELTMEMAFPRTPRRILVNARHDVLARE